MVTVLYSVTGHTRYPKHMHNTGLLVLLLLLLVSFLFNSTSIYSVCLLLWRPSLSLYLAPTLCVGSIRLAYISISLHLLSILRQNAKWTEFPYFCVHIPWEIEEQRVKTAEQLTVEAVLNLKWYYRACIVYACLSNYKYVCAKSCGLVNCFEYNTSKIK